MARIFDNDSIKLGDGTAGATSDLGLYFIDRNANGMKDGTCTTSTTDECYVDVWNNYAEGDLKGKYTPIGATNVALVKPQGKKAVLFSALYNFTDTATFAKKVDNSIAGQMRDCGECHVGGGAFEYVPVAQGTALNPGVRTELRNDPTIVTTGVNAFNYFIDQYDDNNDGNKGEVLAQNYADTGVLEVDCLMCHLEGYSWDDRTHAIRKGNFDASRVAGAGLGTADNVVAGSSAGAGYGKVVTYDPLMVADDGLGNAQLSALALNKIKDVPPSANCSSCHFDLHKVDWKKRGDTWHPNMAYESEVHGSLGCMGCHARTDALTMDPNNNGNPDNPLWTGNAVSGTAATTLGHDPSKGNAPYGAVWNKNDDTVRSCAGCHITNNLNGTSYGSSGTPISGVPNPTDRHAQLGLTQTLIQTKGMGKMDGVADGNHLDIIMCEGCHVRKLGHGPVDSHSLYEWGTGGAMVDGTGPDGDGRLTDHENLYVERTMENNLTVAWKGNKLGTRNALVSMFWLDKDDAVVDINADGQIGGMDAVNSMHVRNAMAVAGLQALTADGTLTEADIIAQKTALKTYLTGIGIGTSDKLKLSMMGVFFKSTHGTTPAANAWGAGGCKDCHGVDKGFYNGPYDLKPRDLEASWVNDAGTRDWSAVEGGGKNWKYVVPFTAVNVDNYSGRDVALPICSSYYGPNERPALPAQGTLGQTGDCTNPNTGAAGTWTVYPLGKIKADQQFTDFHPTTWAKGQVGRSIAITAVLGGTNTIRTMDRSEGLWEASFVTGTYNGAIKGIDGNTYTTRAAWVNYLNNEALGNYPPAIHADHAAYDCSVCHSDGDAILGGTNSAYNLVSDPQLPPEQKFTFVAHEGGQPTCVAACHLTASAPVSPDKAKARLSAKIDMETNFKVNLDGSQSACYHVDVATGQVSQGTNTYAWTIAGATTANTCAAGATCDVTWAAPGGTNNVTLLVSCDKTGTSDSVTVAVTSIDVGKGVQATPTLTYNAGILKAAGLDDEVINGKVQILWGDNTRSDLTDAAAITAFRDTGVAHTYTKAGTYNITVGTTNDGDPNNKMYTYTLEVVVVLP